MPLFEPQARVAIAITYSSRKPSFLLRGPLAPEPACHLRNNLAVSWRGIMQRDALFAGDGYVHRPQLFLVRTVSGCKARRLHHDAVC
jgi:hypothetical protein